MDVSLIIDDIDTANGNVFMHAPNSPSILEELLDYLLYHWTYEALIYVRNYVIPYMFNFNCVWGNYSSKGIHHKNFFNVLKKQFGSFVHLQSQIQLTHQTYYTHKLNCS